jgi:hypothetical protein
MLVLRSADAEADRLDFAVNGRPPLADQPNPG